MRHQCAYSGTSNKDNSGYNLTSSSFHISITYFALKNGQPLYKRRHDWSQLTCPLFRRFLHRIRFLVSHVKRGLLLTLANKVSINRFSAK